MKSWTIINQAQYNYLSRYGFLKADGRRVWTEFKESYHWLVERMEEKIGPSPNDVLYPMWSYVQWRGKNRIKPDIRTLRYTVGNGMFYRLELEIPESRMVLTNYDEWHFVLNQSYISWNEAEESIFEKKEMYEKKLKQINGFYDYKQYSNELKSEVVNSWERIFDLRSFRDTEWLGPLDDITIQATFWKLYKSDIVKIDKFTSRRTQEY